MGAESLLKSLLHVPLYGKCYSSSVALLPKGDLKVAGLNVLFTETSYLPLTGDCLVSLIILL